MCECVLVFVAASMNRIHDLRQSLNSFQEDIALCGASGKLLSNVFKDLKLDPNLGFMLAKYSARSGHYLFFDTSIASISAASPILVNGSMARQRFKFDRCEEDFSESMSINDFSHCICYASILECWSAFGVKNPEIIAPAHLVQDTIRILEIIGKSRCTGCLYHELRRDINISDLDSILDRLESALVIEKTQSPVGGSNSSSLVFQNPWQNSRFYLRRFKTMVQSLEYDHMPFAITTATNLGLYDQIRHRLQFAPDKGISAAMISQDYGLTMTRASQIINDLLKLRFSKQTDADGEVLVFDPRCEDLLRERERSAAEMEPTAADGFQSESGRPMFVQNDLGSSDANEQKSGAFASSRAKSEEATVASAATSLAPVYLELLKYYQFEGASRAANGIETYIFDPDVLRTSSNKLSEMEALVMSHGMMGPHSTGLPHQTSFLDLSVDGLRFAPASTAPSSYSTVKHIGACHTGYASDQLNRISTRVAFPARVRPQEGYPLPGAYMPHASELLPSFEKGNNNVICPWKRSNRSTNAKTFKLLASKVMSVLTKLPGANIDTINAEIDELSSQQLSELLSILARDNLVRVESPTCKTLLSQGFSNKVHISDIISMNEVGAQPIYFLV